MTTLLFLLEELSARTMLESFLPNILPADIFVRYMVFEGKRDLEKRLVKRVREWQMPETRFVVIHDQDSANCIELKQKLSGLCVQSGKARETLIRIPCHELENWYLGDLAAVERALQIRGLARLQQTAKFRNPDHLSNADVELTKLTKYKYQKVSGSREIGKHLSIQGNCSRSFQVFVEGLQRHYLA